MLYFGYKDRFRRVCLAAARLAALDISRLRCRPRVLDIDPAVVKACLRDTLRHAIQRGPQRT